MFQHKSFEIQLFEPFQVSSSFHFNEQKFEIEHLFVLALHKCFLKNMILV